MQPLPETPPNVELLRSLGRLVRGLSALFWALPCALVICVQTAKMDALRSLNIVPPVLVTAWLMYGLWQLGYFQRQERIWVRALDRTKQLALIELGLSPFLYWYNQLPEEPFFRIMLLAMAVGGVLFLSSLNLTIYRLSTMLPDENLRQETRYFTQMNRHLLSGILLLGIIFLILLRMPEFTAEHFAALFNLGLGALWILIFVALLPLALTMAMLWKVKEVILGSVFGAGV